MSLFVGNLSPRARHSDLEYAFRKYGTCRVDMKDGYAFVIYQSVGDAERALSAATRKPLFDDKTTVAWSKRQPPFKCSWEPLNGDNRETADKRWKKDEEVSKHTITRDRKGGGQEVEEKSHVPDAAAIGKDALAWGLRDADMQDPAGKAQWPGLEEVRPNADNHAFLRAFRSNSGDPGTPYVALPHRLADDVQRKVQRKVYAHGEEQEHLEVRGNTAIVGNDQHGVDSSGLPLRQQLDFSYDRRRDARSPMVKNNTSSLVRNAALMDVVCQRDGQNTVDKSVWPSYGCSAGGQPGHRFCKNRMCGSMRHGNDGCREGDVESSRSFGLMRDKVKSVGPSLDSKQREGYGTGCSNHFANNKENDDSRTNLHKRRSEQHEDRPQSKEKKFHSGAGSLGSASRDRDPARGGWKKLEEDIKNDRAVIRQYGNEEGTSVQNEHSRKLEEHTWRSVSEKAHTKRELQAPDSEASSRAPSASYRLKEYVERNRQEERSGERRIRPVSQETKKWKSSSSHSDMRYRASPRRCRPLPQEDRMTYERRTIGVHARREVTTVQMNKHTTTLGKDESRPVYGERVRSETGDRAISRDCRSGTVTKYAKEESTAGEHKRSEQQRIIASMKETKSKMEPGSLDIEASDGSPTRNGKKQQQGEDRRSERGAVSQCRNRTRPEKEENNRFTREERMETEARVWENRNKVSTHNHYRHRSWSPKKRRNQGDSKDNLNFETARRVSARKSSWLSPGSESLSISCSGSWSGSKESSSVSTRSRSESHSIGTPYSPASISLAWSPTESPHRDKSPPNVDTVSRLSPRLATDLWQHDGVQQGGGTDRRVPGRWSAHGQQAQTGTDYRQGSAGFDPDGGHTSSETRVRHKEISGEPLPCAFGGKSKQLSDSEVKIESRLMELRGRECKAGEGGVGKGGSYTLQSKEETTGGRNSMTRASISELKSDVFDCSGLPGTVNGNPKPPFSEELVGRSMDVSFRFQETASNRIWQQAFDGRSFVITESGQDIIRVDNGMKDLDAANFGAARFWPAEVLLGRRMRRGPISFENLERRKLQNAVFGIVDKFIRSSSGWWEEGGAVGAEPSIEHQASTS